ncbi:MAG: hypothetical protein A4E63_02189 [Syntrophorhabdus sp. PtaU1.Bin050]|nr:MAG: hypothetical protein A4E63_02189 [Syntrophorhabdus sp. PtaU1.Bin050]
MNMFHPIRKNNPMLTILVAKLNMPRTNPENRWMKKSTKIWPRYHDVIGMPNPITTAPPRPTISYVPTMGCPKYRRITSATVRNMMKASAVPATAFIHLLNLSTIPSNAVIGPPCVRRLPCRFVSAKNK